MGVLTIQINTPNKRNMHAEIPMRSRAIQTQIYPERHATPGGRFGAAVEAGLVGLLPLQLLEEGVREGFGGEGGHCLWEGVGVWRWRGVRVVGWRGKTESG